MKAQTACSFALPPLPQTEGPEPKVRSVHMHPLRHVTHQDLNSEVRFPIVVDQVDQVAHGRHCLSFTNSFRLIASFPGG